MLASSVVKANMCARCISCFFRFSVIIFTIRKASERDRANKRKGKWKKNCFRALPLFTLTRCVVHLNYIHILSPQFFWFFFGVFVAVQLTAFRLKTREYHHHHPYSIYCNPICSNIYVHVYVNINTIACSLK